MIPKIFHRIWVGNNPMPAEFVRYGQGWIDRHPGWEMRLWTDANRPHPLRNEALYSANRPAAERSDILRWELMLQFGGVYIDTDFECIRNIEPLLANHAVCMARESDTYLANAFLAGKPWQPLFRVVVEALAAKWRRDRKNVSANSGPMFLTALLKEHPELVYHTIGHRDVFPDRTNPAAVAAAYAVHHYAASWVNADTFSAESGWEHLHGK